MSLSVLYKIQGIESEIRRLEKRKEELTQNSNTVQLKDEYLRLKSNASKWEERKRKNELQMESKGNEIHNLQNSIREYDGIVSGQDMGALKKVKNMEQNRTEWEEKLTCANEAMTGLEEEATGISAELDSIKKKTQFISRKYLQQKNNMQAELSSIKEKEEVLSNSLEHLKPDLAVSIMSEYNKLKVKYPNPVAVVEKSICSGCKVEVSMFIYQALKRGSGIVKCECCGRLLYIE